MEKRRIRRKASRSKDENQTVAQLNLQMTQVRKLKPDNIHGKRVLSPLRRLCSHIQGTKSSQTWMAEAFRYFTGGKSEMIALKNPPTGIANRAGDKYPRSQISVIA